jgi:hypothetical protein
MSRKESILIGAVCVLFAGYVYFFTGWLKRPAIMIRQALPRLAMAANQPIPPAAFDLMNKYKLTSVRVVPLRDGKFNKFTPPTWSLVTKSNSVAIKGIVYGDPIPGMTVQTNAQPLAPGKVYRLLVDAGSMHGELDFKPAPPLSPN